MVNHPNRTKGRPKLFVAKLTLDEINAIISTAGNADKYAMAEDHPTEAEGNAFLTALDAGIDKLYAAKYGEK